MLALFICHLQYFIDKIEYAQILILESIEILLDINNSIEQLKFCFLSPETEDSYSFRYSYYPNNIRNVYNETLYSVLSAQPIVEQPRSYSYRVYYDFIGSNTIDVRVESTAQTMR